MEMLPGVRYPVVCSDNTPITGLLHCKLFPIIYWFLNEGVVLCTTGGVCESMLS